MINNIVICYSLKSLHYYSIIPLYSYHVCNIKSFTMIEQDKNIDNIIRNE